MFPRKGVHFLLVAQLIRGFWSVCLSWLPNSSLFRVGSVLTSSTKQGKIHFNVSTIIHFACIGMCPFWTTIYEKYGCWHVFLFLESRIVSLSRGSWKYGILSTRWWNGTYSSRRVGSKSLRLSTLSTSWTPSWEDYSKRYALLPMHSITVYRTYRRGCNLWYCPLKCFFSKKSQTQSPGWKDKVVRYLLCLCLVWSWDVCKATFTWCWIEIWSAWNVELIFIPIVDV